MKQNFVIFDFDGTLADSQGFWGSVLLRIMSDRGLSVDEEDRAYCRTVHAAERWAHLKKKYGLAEEKRPTSAEIMEYIDRFYRTENKLKPGAAEYLQALKAQGKTLAVFTATREESVRAGMRYLGIEHYFDYFFFVPQIGVGKGNPDSYRYCLEKMGAQADDCVMVEDSLYSIRTAKSLGITVYAVYEESYEYFEPEVRALADKFAVNMTEFLKD